jgi:ankyrin repeat protein
MDQVSALFAAVQSGDIVAVRAILAAQPETIHARNAAGDSPLIAAVYSGRREIFDLLIAHGAGVSLHEAAAVGRGDRVAALLDEDPAAVNAYSHDGWTPLHLAAFFGHADVALSLLDRGAAVNARSRSARVGRDNTPLHAAAANRQTRVAELLLERGADVNARDGHGYTPLALAAAGRNDVLQILLLERGAVV